MTKNFTCSIVHVDMLINAILSEWLNLMTYLGPMSSMMDQYCLQNLNKHKIHGRDQAIVQLCKLEKGIMLSFIMRGHMTGLEAKD